MYSVGFVIMVRDATAKFFGFGLSCEYQQFAFRFGKPTSKFLDLGKVLQG